MRYLIFAALLVTVLLLLRSLRGGNSASGGRGPSLPLVEDPVCKTHIPRDTAVVVRRGGRDFYFCSERCAAAFRDTP